MSDSGPNSPRRHPTLWFEDGNVVLQAGDVLYNVHRGVLSRHSAFLRDMFSLPQAGKDPEGSEKRPIVFPGVEAADFSRLVDLVYSCWGDEINADPEALSAMLRVAHKWQFRSIFDGCVRTLSTGPLSPIDQLVLAQDCGVAAWVAPCFVHVAVCLRTLSTQQAAALGAPMTLALLQAQQAVCRARMERACGWNAPHAKGVCNFCGANMRHLLSLAATQGTPAGVPRGTLYAAHLARTYREAAARAGAPSCATCSSVLDRAIEFVVQEAAEDKLAREVFISMFGALPGEDAPPPSL